MNARSELSRIKKEIDAQLALHIDRIIAETRDEDLYMTQVLEHFRSVALDGGKRARPALAIYGHLAAGGQEDSHILQVATGLELVHISFLIHDDIMDRDSVRHGVTTMHAQFARKAEEDFSTKDAEHFGTSIGINMGIYCYALGIELISSAGCDPVRTNHAITKLHETVRRTGLGQLQDVVMEHSDDMDESSIQKIYDNKTARYSFENPLHIGAILAGGDEDLCKQLSAVALPLGIAFQIRDDLLGVFGDESQTGKSASSDIAAGKKTLLAVRAYQALDERDREEFNTLFGKADISNEESDRFREILRESGALYSVTKEMEDYLEKSRIALQSADLPERCVEFLGGLITYIAARNS